MSPAARSRLAAALFGTAVAAVLAGGATLYVRSLRGPEGTIAATIGQGGYRLETTAGGAFTEAVLEGAPSAVFFGFTHCPEVCPTTLGEVAQWQDELAEDGHALRVFFVTVDPERDTVAQLRDYVSWVPGVTGVSGSPEEIAEAVRAFRIFARKVPLEQGGYTMDHTASVLLFGRNGKLAGVLPYQPDPDAAMEAIRALYQG
ncbi:SCO family protein [Poseidonocella sp. HB161398]|uniref:SCO family protein n=1 Tax=Poseidonocella sp. HB161398 TaxID=2320855 RepID=UPI001107C329|nr:SCO family protein [Poseidonocella sp. HB161398]